jgi:hypothetical protein
MCGAIASIFGVFVLWGTIFGHDLKNNSYLFLSRMGVHEGKFWWSRILPAMIFYVPVFISIAVSFYVDVVMASNSPDMIKQRFWTEFVPMGLIVWLSLPALGTFMSLSFRSQVVAFVLTGCAMYALILWMVFFTMVFDCSPLWTALPICAAFFVASRLRARYWFKETFTWRSRLIPLAPVFAVTLAVLTALPFVRIYSVPSISWEQIDAYFDQAEFDKDIIRAPEKRKALLQHIATHGTVPPEYETWLELVKGDAGQWELNAFSGCTLEEYLLLCHMLQYERLDKIFSIKHWRGVKESGGTYMYDTWSWLPFMPWERVRMKRVQRCNLVASITEMGNIQDKRAIAIKSVCKKNGGRFDSLDWGVWIEASGDTMIRMQCYQQIRIVSQAIDKWYAEHEQTLPESLDELVEAGYLSAFPEHPFTEERIGYFRDAPVPSDVNNNDVGGNVLGGGKLPEKFQIHFLNNGGTYLRLGKGVIVIVENEPEEERMEEIEEAEMNGLTPL